MATRRFESTPFPVRVFAAYDRHGRTFEKCLLVGTLALFSYALADWLGWLPLEQGFKPLQSVFLGAALVLQSVAPLVQRRSMLLFFCLLAVSMVLLGAAAFATG